MGGHGVKMGGPQPGVTTGAFQPKQESWNNNNNNNNIRMF